MVIWKCIKSHLSYFIVGQGKECTYVYFHILYWFQLYFKTLCKHFKHNIKILLGASFICINKSSKNNYQNKIIFQNGEGSCQWIWELAILGDPGPDSGDEGKSKRSKKCDTKKSKERREEPVVTMSYQTSSKWSPPFWLLIGARKTQKYVQNMNSGVLFGQHSRFLWPSVEEARSSSEDACWTAMSSPCWLVCSFHLAGNDYPGCQRLF